MTTALQSFHSAPLMAENKNIPNDVLKCKEEKKRTFGAKEVFVCVSAGISPHFALC